MARLQEAAGPDNAISAKKSNVYRETTPNSSNVGVWQVFKIDENHSTNFLWWLTSDYNGRDLYNPTNHSEARKCTTTNGLGWSFTIRDESQKIDLSLQDNTDDHYVQLLCPQCSGEKQITTILATKNQNECKCQNIDFLEQFSLFDENLGQQISQDADTYTLHSYGILSSLDGLKTDLSTWLTKTNFQTNDYIFEGKLSLPAPPPTWKFLQSFFNLQNQIGKNEIAVLPTYPLYRPQYSADYSQRTLHNLGPDLGVPTHHGIYPLIAQLSFSISAAVIDGKLAIKMCPKCALWNPYNISLQYTDYQLDTLIFPQNELSKICLTIRGKPNKLNMREIVRTLALCANEIEQYLHPMFGLNFREAFKAGEVKILSLATDTDFALMQRTSAVSGDYDNCFIIKTDILASDYSNFNILCTDQNGSQNLNWQEFYIRLIHPPSQAILQEVAQLTPDNNNQSLAFTFRPNEKEKILLTLSAAMKIGTMEDAQTATGIRWLAFANPRAPYINRAAFQDPSSIFFGKDFISGNWSWKAQFTSNKAALNYHQLNYLNEMVLFDVPNCDYGILNIAALQHVNWTPLGYLPNVCLGNSSANPYLSSRYTIFQNAPGGTWQSHCKVESLFDYSYLLNQVLFDHFFCSTLNLTEDKLVNQRFKILHGKVKPENLLVKGSFNVHSTSPKVWEAYLASRANVHGEIIFPRICNVNRNKYLPFPRHYVQNLAQDIVALIEQRSLFPTLSAFINRQLTDNDTTCGLLQEAIFNSNINHRTCKHYVSFKKNKSWFNDRAASGYLEEGLPNVLSQADILLALAHFISVRGDTFKIITQGTNRNYTRRCEAIVQRMPTFVNPKENRDIDTSLSTVNRKLGRRFNVILFRWL
ncbi:MAG: hypothetical protein LBF25_00850, partial [Puniceicoccales bacterium]|jgi:hypothetical protein|nr:hypothetical protein [Puniceicoccales bacterium]